tara:strand:- start:15742 stop:16107 length:366 start_codon:yes stop_codon:yes gene_type:complete
MKNKSLIYWGIIIFIIIVGAFAVLKEDSKNYDDFAKCLTEKEVKFYGSFECPHCAQQKSFFGDSIEFVDYIECGPLGGPMNQVCKDVDIRTYPTWFIDDSRYEGTQTFVQLSKLSGCSLSN